MTKAVKSSSLLDVLLVSGSKWSGHFVVAPVLDTLTTYINHRAAEIYDIDFEKPVSATDSRLGQHVGRIKEQQS
jgi:hypothetical protein